MARFRMRRADELEERIRVIRKQQQFHQIETQSANEALL